MNLMSERTMQAGMQFSAVTSTPASQHQQKPGGQARATAAADAAAGGTTATTASVIPATEPKPVLVGVTREVALQRLQDWARMSSSDLTGVAGSKSGGSRSLQTKPPVRTKREEGRGGDKGGRGTETSPDRESDDDGGPRAYTSRAFL